jgi:hypothetical protein
MGEFRYVGNAALQMKAMRALKTAVEKGQHDLVAGARPLTNIDTGAERSGIHAGPVMASGTSVIGRVLSSMEYDIFQHEGTRYMEGTFFLERPLLEGRAAFLSAAAAAARLEF